jgi:iron complex transport system ATP-binding protein
MSLSDGEKQKILIARALAQEPKLILLDEPTSHLDLKHKIEVMQILKSLAKKGVAIVLALHDIDLAMGNCDRVILIKNHEIFATGTPEKVMKGMTIKELFDMSDTQFQNMTTSLNNYVKELNF